MLPLETGIMFWIGEPSTIFSPSSLLFPTTTDSLTLITQISSANSGFQNMLLLLHIASKVMEWHEDTSEYGPFMSVVPEVVSGNYC